MGRGEREKMRGGFEIREINLSHRPSPPLLPSDIVAFFRLYSNDTSFGKFFVFSRAPEFAEGFPAFLSK